VVTKNVVQTVTDAVGRTEKLKALIQRKDINLTRFISTTRAAFPSIETVLIGIKLKFGP